MQEYFGDDTRRVNHALAVLDYARQIRQSEPGGKLVVECAATLHDIGIHEAERKYQSSAGNYQELEGPGVARPILEQHGLAEDNIEHICKIIANHHCARDIDTPEFRIIWDADWLVNIPDEFDLDDQGKIAGIINKVLKTETGAKLARVKFLYSVKTAN